MNTKEKLTEIISNVVVNDKGNRIRDVFHPEFVEKIVNNLIEGGAIVPLCKVGDIVWYELYDEIRSSTVYSCEICLCGRGFWISDAKAKDEHGLEMYFNGKSIGKTVFLTREEAEKVLKGE